jgi:short-subunit dehydrogenase
MTLYRATAGDGVAWITGASTGMGRELAIHLAQAGFVVAATARGADKLHLLEAESATLRGRIRAFPCDMTDRTAVQAVVDAIAKQLGPITLAVFNAGNDLNLDNIIKTYQVNVFGTVNGLVPVAKVMHAQGRGQIAIVGSVSSYFGLPTAAAYGASKAALNNMAEALRFDFEKMNIRIQMLNPGFVDTPLTERNTFPMPALMSVQDAGNAMYEGILHGGFEVTFPRRFTWVMKFGRLLPHVLRFPVLFRAMGWKTRAVKPPKSD